MIVGCVKDCPGPVVISCIGTAADLADGFLGIIVSHISLVASVKIAVVCRTHVAATTPVLIAHAKVVNLPGLLVTVFLS